MPKKGLSQFHPIRYSLALGASTRCQRFFFFFPLRRKGLLDHTVNNEMFALAMLTLYKNLLIAHIKGPLSVLSTLNLEKM